MFYTVHFTVESGAEHSAQFYAFSEEEAIKLFREDFGPNIQMDGCTEDCPVDPDEYDGQPDEMQEWHDFDPDC